MSFWGRGHGLSIPKGRGEKKNERKKGKERKKKIRIIN